MNFEITIRNIVAFHAVVIAALVSIISIEPLLGFVFVAAVFVLGWFSVFPKKEGYYAQGAIGIVYWSLAAAFPTVMVWLSVTVFTLNAIAYIIVLYEPSKPMATRQ